MLESDIRLARKENASLDDKNDALDLELKLEKEALSALCQKFEVEDSEY